jgi:hypothetical protein
MPVELTPQPHCNNKTSPPKFKLLFIGNEENSVLIWSSSGILFLLGVSVIKIS